MEEELVAGGWTKISDFEWKAPNGNAYSGVEYCWRILKGDEFSKSPFAWARKRN